MYRRRCAGCTCLLDLLELLGLDLLLVGELLLLDLRHSLDHQRRLSTNRLDCLIGEDIVEALDEELGDTSDLGGVHHGLDRFGLESNQDRTEHDRQAVGSHLYPHTHPVSIGTSCSLVQSSCGE